MYIYFLQLYKKEYVKKNRRPGPRHYTLPYYRMPWILSPDYSFPRVLDPRFPHIFGPDLDSDIGYCKTVSTIFLYSSL